MDHGALPLLQMCLKELTEAVIFKCCIECRLHDFGPVQIHDREIRDFLPLCQVYDLYRIIVISIGKQKDFKIRGLYIFVQP